jgi:hypothetical protein
MSILVAQLVLLEYKSTSLVLNFKKRLQSELYVPNAEIVGNFDA